MKNEERSELVKYRIKRAKETLAEVSLLLENDFLNTAVNRVYYACYYAVIALLVKNKISATTHNGVRQMFGLHFVKTGMIERDIAKFYTDIFDKRQTGDYDDFVEFSQEEVSRFIEPANKLIKKIETLINS
jgi:uncharacterized protein (UPF0332 family)